MSSPTNIDHEKQRLERITQEFREGKMMVAWEVKTLLRHHFPNEYATLKPYEKGRIRGWVQVFCFENSWKVFGLHYIKNRPSGQLVLKLVRQIFGEQEFVVH